MTARPGDATPVRRRVPALWAAAVALAWAGGCVSYRTVPSADVGAGREVRAVLDAARDETYRDRLIALATSVEEGELAGDEAVELERVIERS